MFIFLNSQVLSPLRLIVVRGEKYGLMLHYYYHFPLFYPDWGFANLVYFLRIRANLFYDFTQTKSLRTGNRYNFASTGAEIFFDTQWWNQQPVSFGIRYSRLLNDDFKGRSPNQWEIVVPVSLVY